MVGRSAFVVGENWKKAAEPGFRDILALVLQRKFALGEIVVEPQASRPTSNIDFRARGLLTHATSISSKTPG